MRRGGEIAEKKKYYRVFLSNVMVNFNLRTENQRKRAVDVD